MSERDPQRTEPEDLSAEVRRGHASRAQERALFSVLLREPALRVAHQVGLDFDREACVRAGDEELILRAADAALARALPAARRRGLRGASFQMVAALAVIAVLSVTGIGAALWVAGVRPWRQALVSVPKVAPLAPGFARARNRALRPPRTQVAAERAEAAAEPALALVPVVPVELVPTHRVQPARAQSVDAAALFHAANSARHAGQLARARKLYGDLIRQASGSDEAHVAHVSLGKLLLAQGQVDEAERAFQRYLTAGGGPLSEEALFHRAQCLTRLGKLGSERLAWRALLAAYPESVYAARARERLARISALGVGSGP